MEFSKEDGVPEMVDIRRDYEKFREIVKDYATRIIDTYPEAGIKRDWVAHCYSSFNVFVQRFPDTELRQRMLTNIEQMVSQMEDVYKQLVTETIGLDIRQPTWNSKDMSQEMPPIVRLKLIPVDGGFIVRPIGFVTTRIRSLISLFNAELLDGNGFIDHKGNSFTVDESISEETRQDLEFAMSCQAECLIELEMET